MNNTRRPSAAAQHSIWRKPGLMEGGMFAVRGWAFLAAFVALGTVSTPAAVYFTDAINYSAGNLGSMGSAGGWQNSNSGVTVGPGNLDGSGLGLAVSGGNQIVTTTASAVGTFNQFSSGITSGRIYYSFLLRVNVTAGLDANGKVLTGLIRNGSASSYYVDAWLRLHSGLVQLGVSKLRGEISWLTTPLTVGATYFVVLQYEFVASSNNDGVALWLNPGAGGSEPAAALAITSGSDGNSGTGIGRCYVYGGMNVNLDELRIASTWEEVTPGGGGPPGNTPPKITEALFTPQGFVLRGSHGTAGGPFDVMATGDVALPPDEWTDIASENFATDGTFSVTNPVLAAGAQQFYRLRLVGPPGPVAPGIVTQPESRTNFVGTSATFSVLATGATPLSYRWFFNGGTPVTGVTAATLTWSNVQPEHEGDYTVVITNIAGAVTSSVARLTVSNLLVAPSISTPLQDQTVNSGQTVNFAAVAEGPGPLHYQWYYVPETALTNQTNATLTLTSVTTNDNGGYFAIVTNRYGAATTSIATLTVNPPDTNAPDFSEMGFAGAGFNLTGGEGGQVVTVTTGAELKAYSDSNTKYIIYVSGELSVAGMDTHVRSHKTIIGLGTNATLNGGGLYMYNASNIIVRNLTIKNSTDDNIGITSGSSRVWIDHCTFYDSADGGMDIVKGADYVTVSWCKFYYTNPANTHRFVNLVGASDGDGSRDMGKLRVTFHHNWWSTLCKERMPSVRYGRAHVFNNYFNAPGNNYCIRTRLYAESRIENNFFENVKNPWEVYLTSGTPGKVFVSGNVLVNTTSAGNGSDVIIPPGTDAVFTPSYSYPLQNAADIPAVVMEHAGAGRGPFAP